MSPLQVLLYFFREAVTGMRRSWRITMLATVTIGISLFVGGLFLMMGSNLSSLVEEWRGETKIIVYLESGAGPARIEELVAEVRKTAWVVEVEAVTVEEARERFRRLFPTLEDLVEGWGDEPLPASLEIRFDPLQIDSSSFDLWLDDLGAHPEIQMIDDDRAWLEQLTTLVNLVRSLGVGLGGVLLGAAIFTIASVVKLTAYLYRHEIEVMRLVGATEFVIRGPFYVEGLLQGLAGGMLALGGLAGSYAWLASGGRSSLLTSFLAKEFLPWQHVLFLIAVGASAGVLGAVLSLRAEVSKSES